MHGISFNFFLGSYCRISDIKSKVAAINDAFDNSNHNLDNATYLLKNASKFFEIIKNNLGMAGNEFNDRFMINIEVNNTLNERVNDINTIRDLINNAENHQNQLLHMVIIMNIL